MVEVLHDFSPMSFWPNSQHSSAYFFLTAATYPFLLVVIARASRLRWGATLAAGTYMIFHCGACLILPLFAASRSWGDLFRSPTWLSAFSAVV